MTILVTGGCGFIGSNFIRWHNKKNPKERIVNVDALTYAGNIRNLDGIGSNYKFYYCDIRTMDKFLDVLEYERPHIIYNFAAESHVDNSINNAFPFVETNVLGTVSILEAIRRYGKPIRLVHVSTDEVYGSLNATDAPFSLTTPYSPRSPYSASKAASDHFVMAYYHTYGSDCVLTNCSNNYGPYQHVEKLIPTIITKALAGEEIPIYGMGTNVRDWIHVEDHCRGVYMAGEMGESGKKYLFGGENQMANVEMAKWILEILDIPLERITFVEDRKGHDFRYDIDTSASREELLWEPKIDLENGLKATIEWYKNNVEWTKTCERKR